MEVRDWLFSFAAKRLPGHAAEDIIGQTFEIVWKKRAECPDDPNARVQWAWGIGRNKIKQEIDRRRRKHHDNRFILDLIDPEIVESLDPEVHDLVGDQDLAMRVRARLSALDLELLDVAILSGLSREQAAAFLGLSVGALRTRISRLRAKIRRFLKESDSVEEKS